MLVPLFLVFFGSCTTVKNVGTVSTATQAIVTGGVSLIPTEPKEKIKISIKGQVFLSSLCHFDNSQHSVELSLPNSSQKFAQISIDSKNEFSEIGRAQV